MQGTRVLIRIKIGGKKELESPNIEQMTNEQNSERSVATADATYSVAG